MPNWTNSQQAVIDHTGSNLLVSAAAGSGKTAVMIEHIYKTVCSGNGSLDRMLVATYTNAAAASMKEKLSQKFDKALSSDPANTILLRQKQLLDRADISTIHSFCIKTLRRYYFRTPLPPDFRIFESSQLKMISSAAVKQVIESAAKRYNDGLFPEYSHVLLQFAGKKNDSSLEKLITDLDRATESLTDPDEFKKLTLTLYSNKDGSFYKDYILNYSKDLLKTAIDFTYKIIEKYRLTEISQDTEKHMAVYQNMFSEALSATDIEGINTALSQRLNTPKGKTAELKKIMVLNTGLLKDIRNHIKDITSNIDNTDITKLLPAVKGLFTLYDEYIAQKEELMLKEGGCDFTGVLRYMVRLLSENDDIREELKNNIDHIYIDEYQDSNAFQNCIIESLSKGNNMFFVGDIKQSIYGFQHARPALFREKMFSYGNGEKGTRINLMNNFRSYPEILNGVNFIFKNIMSNEDISEITYDSDAFLYPSPDKASPQYSDCLYKNSEPEASNEVMICIGDESDEAQAVAERIQELLKTSIYDKETDSFRAVRYGDIAILGRTKKIGDRFSPVFEQMGIPFSRQEKEKADNSDTTATIISLLNLLILRRSDVDLITVLLSNLGNFTPTELGKIRAENKHVSFYDALLLYNKNPDIKNKINDFFDLLDKLELIQKTMGLSDFIEYLADETGYIYHAAYLPKSAKEQDALKNLILSAQAYSDFSDSGLRGFLEYYKNTNEPANDGFTIDENDNSVHFMTIHKSKGLEFPIVIVAGCSDVSGTTAGAYSFDENLGFAFNNYSIDSLGLRKKQKSITTRTVNIVQEKLDIAEGMRVFYVALTRAKNKLILCVSGKESYISERCIIPHSLILKSYTSYSDLILPLIFNHRDGSNLRKYIDKGQFILDDDYVFEESQWIVNIYTEYKNTVKTSQLENEEVTFNKEAYFQYLNNVFSWEYPFKCATTQRTKQSPSKKQLRITPPLRRPQFEDKKYEGAQKGTVVHFFMEHVSFDSGDSAKTQAIKMLEEGILTQKEYDALPMQALESFMNSDIAQRIKKANLLCRERSFCHIIPYKETGDESLVQGIIDCYFFEGENIILLDYKTDIINNDLDEHVLHHTPQLKMYKAALEQLYPGKNVFPYIHFFHVDKTIEIK